MAIQVFKVPFDAVPQRFTITISNTVLILRSTWNAAMQNWTLSFYNASDESIVQNIPLVTGVDIFEQFRYLQLFPGKLFVFTQGDDLATPTLENLGQESNLFYVTES